MADPPLSEGAAQVSATEPAEGTAAREPGAAGVVKGVLEAAEEALPVPAAFIAATVKL
jgi:hypothetical protein